MGNQYLVIITLNNGKQELFWYTGKPFAERVYGDAVRSARENDWIGCSEIELFELSPLAGERKPVNG